MPHKTAALFAPLGQVIQLPSKREKLYTRLLGTRVVDALWHLPKDILTRRPLEYFSQGHIGETVTLLATVIQHRPTRKRGHRYTIQCFDGQSYFDVVYFHAHNYLPKILPVDAKRLISGKIDIYQGQKEIVHPDYIGATSQKAQWDGPQPVYALTAGVTQKSIRQTILEALSHIPNLADWLPEDLRSTHQWPDWKTAIYQVHHPQKPDHLTLNDPSRQRLAFDELLANQIALQLARSQIQSHPGHAMQSERHLREAIISTLPFSLTTSQQHALDEIFRDMGQTKQMLRLLQGDVGSGKTVVSLLAATLAIECGFQVALLAPTDILARQHFQTLQRLTQHVPLTLDLLTGRDQRKKRQAILENLANGHTHFLIGTHAIIEDTVYFQRLGLTIIDEQHRFGVEQRLKLMRKGQNPHLLALSATPIPRTMQSILYGDLDVSILKEKPAGRTPPITKVLSNDRYDDIIQALHRALAQQTKVYWVCPLVKESETLDLTAAIERYEMLGEIFGEKVGLVHGKMPGKEKDQVMQDFASGGIDILVSTTVIEVGVDVAAANIMIIENAQRFGLSQLHQLRGRIGRNTNTSQPTCLLLYQNPLSLKAQRRLEIMRSSHDGFYIAEEDLKLRGAGDILGTQQSGLPQFRFFDIIEDADAAYPLLQAADEFAKKICAKDPQLLSAQGQSLRFLLHLFERNKALAYVRSA